MLPGSVWSEDKAGLRGWGVFVCVCAAQQASQQIQRFYYDKKETSTPEKKPVVEYCTRVADANGFEYRVHINQQGSIKTPGGTRMEPGSYSKNNSFCEQRETFLLLVLQGVNGRETAQGLLSDLPLTYKQPGSHPPWCCQSTLYREQASQGWLPRQQTHTKNTVAPSHDIRTATT